MKEEKREDTNLAGCHGLAWDEQLGVDVLEVPLEGLALEVVSEVLAVAHVAEVALEAKKLVPINF